jgi:hypothetical protein
VTPLVLGHRLIFLQQRPTTNAQSTHDAFNDCASADALSDGLERQYLPAHWPGAVQETIARWIEKSKEFHRRVDVVTVAYGGSDRQSIDLLRSRARQQRPRSGVHPRRLLENFPPPHSTTSPRDYQF